MRPCREAHHSLMLLMRQNREESRSCTPERGEHYTISIEYGSLAS